MDADDLDLPVDVQDAALDPAGDDRAASTARRPFSALSAETWTTGTSSPGNS
ncbi:MAG: hypothetical protein HOV92_04745 [Streptomyces sp.]|nr:hypothetical protein [Streptomyces sp.]